MIRRAVLAIAIATLAATPALADPNCLNRGGGMKLNLTLGAQVGEDYTETEQSTFDVMSLRRHGIDADTAERTWLGCIKVTRFEGGAWVTEYYDPNTYDLVY
jgi:microcystin degradation protein MlrC